MQKGPATFRFHERGFVTHILLIGLFGLILVLALSFIFIQPKKGPIKTVENQIPTVKPVSADSGPIEVQKLYSNNDLGIEFSYDDQKYQAKEDTEADYFKRTGGDSRKNFTYYVGFAPGEVTGAVDLLDRSEPSPENAPFLIWVFNNPDNLDAAGWFKKYWYYPFNWGQFEPREKVKLAPVSEATISGEIVNYAEIPYQLGSPKYYYLSKNGKMFLIRVLNDDQTIESLKFL